MDAAGQAIAGAVLPSDGLLQGIGVHDAEDGAEALILVVPRTRLDIIANTRGPQGALFVELLRLQQPLLARLQLGQAAQQLLTRLFSQAIHRGGDVIARARLQGLDGIQQLLAHALGLARSADENHQRSGRTLLAGVAEGGVVQVLDGQVRVGGRGDDQRVLTGGLCHQVHLGLPGAEERAGIGCTGQDDVVHVIVGKQGFACVAFISQHQLDQIRIQAFCLQGGAEGFNHHLAAVDHLGSRLDDDRRARSQGGRNAAGRNGDGEVPRRGHHGDGVRVELGVCLFQEASRLPVVGAEVNGL